jgi:hypothetical protein
VSDPPVREARKTVRRAVPARCELIIAATLVLTAVLAVSGCQAKKPAATFSATDPAGRAACYKVQQDYETAVTGYEMAHPQFRPPMTPAQWENAAGIKVPYCPAGGDLGWDPTQQQLICSLHGHYNTD